MPVFPFWRRRPVVTRFGDTICLARSTTLHWIHHAIQQRVPKDDLVLVISHFPETFFQTQDYFNEQNLTYELCHESLRLDRIVSQRKAETPATVLLGLADLIEADDSLERLDRTHHLSVIVVERHPSATHDEKIEQFVSSLPCNVRFGYFLSMEDPTVQTYTGQWTTIILKQWGMKEDEMITSDLVSRQLKLRQRRTARLVLEDQPTDSPQQWLERYIPETEKRDRDQ